ncbi:MAG: chorismate synthase, partial [Holophagales bacterium]|nr:chorismate synthase [Holophagales bacterium]
MSRLRFLTAGESHGPLLTAILEGLPAGLRLDVAAIDADLARRQHGYGRGGRMKLERDRVRFTGGLRGGETLGSPLSMTIENLDHGVWGTVMGPLEVDAEAAAKRRLSSPRPGHADLAGGLKYGRHDLRDVLERASARRDGRPRRGGGRLPAAARRVRCRSAERRPVGRPGRERGAARGVVVREPGGRRRDLAAARRRRRPRAEDDAGGRRRREGGRHARRNAPRRGARRTARPRVARLV